MVAARGEDGAYAAFDTVENRHRDHILDLTLAPARIPEPVDRQAQAIARRVADALDLVGLLAVEMFVDRDGRVLVNEIAPRPHNSGHWTIDACPASQFELHIRAIAGLPLPPAVRHSDAVMKNLVGPEEAALWPAILATPGLIPHLYGKVEARPGRKMGHVTRLFPRGSLPRRVRYRRCAGAGAHRGTEATARPGTQAHSVRTPTGQSSGVPWQSPRQPACRRRRGYLLRSSDCRTGRTARSACPGHRATSRRAR